MSLENWGGMTKAQDDSQTINEAITAAIVAHEADPESHMGAGESIENHRTNEIIDHKAGSVLADKLTQTELSITENFANLDNWNKIGEVNNSNWPDCSLYVEWGAVNKSEIYLTPQSPSPFLDYTYNMLFQVVFRTEMSGSNLNGWFGLGSDDSVDGGGFGFKIVAGVMRAYIEDSSVGSYSVLAGADLAHAHIYRALLIPAEGVVRYYIDGSLVATLSIPFYNPESDLGPDIGVKLTGSLDGNFIISDLHFARALLN